MNHIRASFVIMVKRTEKNSSKRLHPDQETTGGIEMRLTRSLSVALAVSIIFGTIFMANPAYARHGGADTVVADMAAVDSMAAVGSMARTWLAWWRLGRMRIGMARRRLGRLGLGYWI